MGVRILLDIIRIVQPMHVIQINCESQSTNNLPELNKEFLQNETGWSYHLDIERYSCFFNCIQTNSLCDFCHNNT